MKKDTRRSCPVPIICQKVFFPVFFGAILFFSCGCETLARVVIRDIRPDFSFHPDSVPPVPDYGDPDSWVAFDSILAHEVDVFFIHPTTYQGPGNWNQPLDDERVNRWTYNGPIRQQASAFRGAANLFAPRYRQANLFAFVDRRGDGEQALDLAYKDVEAAFEYFLEEVNGGRPFVLASHSQGSRHADRLIRESLAFREVRDRFVAGYLIGWPITADDVKAYPGEIGVCRDSVETGCIVTWNTQRRRAWYSLVRDKSTVAVNPLSWTTDEAHYDRDLNQGAVFFRGGEVKRFPHFTGARLRKGKLIVDKDFTDDRRLERAGKINYHRYDYTFFYENISLNAARRISSFFDGLDRRTAERQE